MEKSLSWYTPKASHCIIEKKNTFEKTRATKCSYMHFIVLQLNKVVKLARAFGVLIARGKIVCEALKSRLAHSCRGLSGFCSMKQLEVFLLPLDGMLVHRRPLPRNLSGFPNNSPVPIYTPGWREATLPCTFKPCSDFPLLLAVPFLRNKILELDSTLDARGLLARHRQGSSNVRQSE